MSKLYDGPVSDIPGTGPAPYLMRVEDWKRVGGRLGGQIFGRVVDGRLRVCRQDGSGSARGATPQPPSVAKAANGTKGLTAARVCSGPGLTGSVRCSQVTPDWEKMTASWPVHPCS